MRPGRSHLVHRLCVPLVAGPPGVHITEVLHSADKRGDTVQFDFAKAKEMEGLVEKGFYKLMCKDDVSCDANVLGGRFVLYIKNIGAQDDI